MTNDKGLKVLIVDDDKNICDLLRLYLEKDGYSVLLCHDGDDAVVKFKALSPDMVLLDIMLPGKDGWQEMCRLRDLDLIYICTDWASHCEMAVEAMRHGKHAAVEVPAATTVEECRLLVETAETFFFPSSLRSSGVKYVQPAAVVGRVKKLWQLRSSPGFMPVRSRHSSTSPGVWARWSWTPRPCSLA